MCVFVCVFCFSGRRRHTRCALLTGVQTCALPICQSAGTAGGATRGGRPVKPAPFDYYAPATVDEACQLLTDAGGGATLLAGGQTLMPLLALRMSQPFVLVDLNRIKGLSGVTRNAGRTRLGPITRQNHVTADRTDERRVGQECGCTCRSRRSPY